MEPHAASPEDHVAALRWTAVLARSLARGADADDVVQETWTRATRDFGPGHVPPRSWLAGTMRSIAHRLRRSDARRLLREAACGDRDGSAPSAAELVERAELQRAIADEVLSLDETNRELILLRYQEGCSVAEIGRRLSIARSTAGERLERARRVLARRFHERLGGGWRSALLVAIPNGGAHWAPITVMAKTVTSPAAAVAVLALLAAVVALVSIRLIGGDDDGVEHGAVVLIADNVSGRTAPLPAPRAGSDGRRNQVVAIDDVDLTQTSAAEAAAPEPWSVLATIRSSDVVRSSTRGGLLAFVRRVPSIIALPERVADGAIAGTESLDVRVVEQNRGNWRFTPTDPGRESIVLACVLGDRVLATQTADRTTGEVAFTIDSAEARRLATGSVRFRVRTSREGDDGGPTGRKVHHGLAAARSQGVGARSMYPLDEGVWTVIEDLPTCPLRLTVRGTNFMSATRSFELEPGELLDLGTIYTDEPLDFVFFRLVRPDGTPLEANGKAVDLRTGDAIAGFQEWSLPGTYLTTTRPLHDLALRVEAPGWSEVPIPIARDRIRTGHPRDVETLPHLEIPVEPAAAVLWSLELPARRASDFVVLRTASAAPIRIFPADEVQNVVSFLPPARYQWTLHRGTGVQLGRVTADVVEGQPILRLTLDGAER